MIDHANLSRSATPRTRAIEALLGIVEGDGPVRGRLHAAQLILEHAPSDPIGTYDLDRGRELLGQALDVGAEIVYSALLLVEHDVPGVVPNYGADLLTPELAEGFPSLEEIAVDWSPLDRCQVHRWAIAKHLRAGDNDAVEIPPTPAVLLKRMQQAGPLDWARAEGHLRRTERAYQELAGQPGVNVMFAAGVVASARRRFDQGERTPELYRSIMELE